MKQNVSIALDQVDMTYGELIDVAPRTKKIVFEIETDLAV